MTANAFDAHAAAGYASRPARQVPGYADLHRMVAMLLAEKVPTDGRLLILGAGGGLEIKALADRHAGWRFDGVDPSPDMLTLARQVAASAMDRTILHEGTIAVAPDGPFDGATSLQTLHFISREERLETLVGLRGRLRAGAPLVLAHISFPQSEPERSQWIDRHVAWGATAPMSTAQAESARQAIGTRLTILDPEAEEAMLRAAGFTDISLFYAAMSFRGWMATAG